ncbi:unnamed protein product [Durusdinium trenchii]|uniref:Uncharacterized protein n=1 Tax=Durusdinium trenchii TaxID=1381693 RepID=A0ABP0NRS3_9DINO
MAGASRSLWLQETSLKLDSYCWREHTLAKPIQYSIPTRKWQHYRPLRERRKTWDFAPLIPGDPQTYQYTEEESYLEMYASSLFCITKKKGGWDCLRHYEILLAGCMPYFLDIDLMPSRSMVNFPKLLIQALMRLPGVPPESDVVEAMSNGTGSRLTLDHGRFDRALFERLRKKVLHYVEDGNTKEFMLSSQRALELRITTPRVFVHSTCTAAKPVDYLRELLVIGLLELGLEIYVNCDMSYIFADFDVANPPPSARTSYGRGFLYERALETSAQQRLTFWRTGDPVPSEPLTYVKTTYNNKPIPQEDLVSRGVDLVVDGNDIWAPHHPPPSSALQRWFLREGTSCHEFQRPAQQVLAMLDSGDLWNCDHAPGSHLCPNLHEAASLWYEGRGVFFWNWAATNGPLEAEVGERLGAGTQMWNRTCQYQLHRRLVKGMNRGVWPLFIQFGHLF